MKYTIMFYVGLLLLTFISNDVHAQEDKSKRPSPPAVAKGTIGGADVAIYYSTPAIKGRLVWGALVPYGKLWRTGANEATVFETSQEIKISGQVVPAGKYALFSIPGEREWTFILNSNWNQWGAFKYDKALDVLRFTALPQKSSEFNERLKFEIVNDEVILNWENLQVGFVVNGGKKDKPDGIRVSPASTERGSLDEASITINYSQPAVNGRKIWGELVPYNQVWRTGANEATTFEVDKDVFVSGQRLPAGKYALFTIPGEKEWTVIFNSNWDQWGCFTYDQSKDVLRFNTMPTQSTEFNERLKFDVVDNDVLLLWENLQLRIPVRVQAN